MNEAELLFTEILKCGRASLYLRRHEALGLKQTLLISSVLKRRLLQEPIQYILGHTEFMGFNFKVTPAVFIPRPETEILVETTIKYVSKCQGIKASELNLLDLGTGSGCIAVSLAKFLPHALIAATDISPEAITVARENARLNGTEDRVTFAKADLFTNDGLPITDYDVIVSNPPYIPSGEIAKLQDEIRYEPRIALDGGRDGMDFYRRLALGACAHLKRGGLLITEIGYNQAEPIRNIFHKSGNFEIIESIKDYNYIERVVVLQNINPKSETLNSKQIQNSKPK